MTALISRSVPVDLAVQGDGRTVEAYAAAFNEDAEIVDHEGHYLERLAPGAFKRAINRAKPQGGREHWLSQVFYNHGMTLHGTPSEAHSRPIGVTRHIEEDSRGLLTVTRYSDTPLGNEVLALIKEGALNAQSFTGAIMRSTPEMRRGQRRRPGPDGLQTVTRTELGLKEYGPTPMPAYVGAAIIGTRSLDLSALLSDADSVRALRDLLNAAPSEDSAAESGADPDGSLAADDSPAPVAARSTPPDDPFQRRLSVALRARGINP